MGVDNPRLFALKLHYCDVQDSEGIKMTLYTSSGKEYTGMVEDDGKPFFMESVECERCHVYNGQRLWVMGTENGRPYSRTGFDCWTCGNTGVRKVIKSRLYSAAALAKKNAAADKRAETKRLKYVAEQQKAASARVEVETAYRAKHADFLAKIGSLCIGSGEAFFDRMAADLLQALRAPSERQIALIDAEVAKRAKDGSSAFVGAVGDKITMTLTVERIIVLEHPFYGTNYINVCRDGSGNVVTYKGRSNIGDKGDTCVVKATVAGHTIYNNINQTVIQRPKLVN